MGRRLYFADGSRVTEHVLSWRLRNACTWCHLPAVGPPFSCTHDASTHEVWMVIAHKARRPRADYRLMRVVHFSGKSLSYGVEEEKLEGIAVRVFVPAKTVADCFKYRNKIGLEVALEALRDCYRQRKATMDELFMAAKSAELARVMPPHLESLAAYYSSHLDRGSNDITLFSCERP